MPGGPGKDSADGQGSSAIVCRWPGGRKMSSDNVVQVPGGFFHNAALCKHFLIGSLRVLKGLNRENFVLIWKISF